jgi:hypothetical protein
VGDTAVGELDAQGQEGPLDGARANGSIQHGERVCATADGNSASAVSADSGPATKRAMCRATCWAMRHQVPSVGSSTGRVGLERRAGHWRSRFTVKVRSGPGGGFHRSGCRRARLRSQGFQP